MAKIWDPRAQAVTNEWMPHDGGKAFKLLFLGESGRMLSCGFTKQVRASGFALTFHHHYA